jgi:hypothetical protein
VAFLVTSRDACRHHVSQTQNVIHVLDVNLIQSEKNELDARREMLSDVAYGRLEHLMQSVNCEILLVDPSLPESNCVFRSISNLNLSESAQNFVRICCHSLVVYDRLEQRRLHPCGEWPWRVERQN